MLSNNLRVYHASLDIISSFRKNTHFGGRASALEAVSRKNINNDKIYLYECLLDLPKRKYECFDVGGDENWNREIKYALEDAYTIIQYTNKYEPDTTPSFVVLNPSLIRITSVSYF